MSAPSTPALPDNDTVIWRYMDDWKFESFLAKFCEHDKWVEALPGTTIQFNDPGQLWFAYPWTFEDDREGLMPEVNKYPEEFCDRMAALSNLSSEESEKRRQHFLAADTPALRECLVSMAQICGVACWNANTDESTDMWPFVAEQNGVAIKTTVGKLKEALDYAHNSPRNKARPSVCSVDYIDHSTYFLPQDGFRNLLSIIQSGHSYENEVRFVAKSPDLAKVPTRATRAMPEDPADWEQAFKPLTNEDKEKYIFDCGKQCAASFQRIRSNCEEGFNLPIKLDGLIDEVVLKAGCTSDYRESVEEALGKAGLVRITIRELQR